MMLQGVPELQLSFNSKLIIIIDHFCVDTGMEINMDKTEITVCRNGGSLRRYERGSFCGTQINITSEYKYMGIL